MMSGLGATAVLPFECNMCYESRTIALDNFDVATE